MSSFLSDALYSHDPGKNLWLKMHSSGGQQQQFVGENEPQQQMQKDDELRALEMLSWSTDLRFKGCGCPRTRDCNCS